MVACTNNMCSFAHSVSTLKCRINRSVFFKYFDRLSRFNRFNRDPVFNDSMPRHSQIVYGSNASNNNSRPEPVQKFVETRGPTNEHKNHLFGFPRPNRTHDNFFNTNIVLLDPLLVGTAGQTGSAHLSSSPWNSPPSSLPTNSPPIPRSILPKTSASRVLTIRHAVPLSNRFSPLEETDLAESLEHQETVYPRTKVKTKV